MQDQLIIKNVFDVKDAGAQLALLPVSWHINLVLGMCGAGRPSQACVSTEPPPQTPVRRGDAADPSEKVRKKSGASRTFLQVLLQPKEIRCGQVSPNTGLFYNWAFQQALKREAVHGEVDGFSRWANVLA